jgi:hypothetical protein
MLGGIIAIGGDSNLMKVRVGDVRSLDKADKLAALRKRRPGIGNDRVM